ncbi:uncharacterized protein PRCAT00005931001 [Priceomyces carsonii]|uniref:uncharacterized protein n=1 Tax=Priceomyces carsonii TaxID=28549 RepID=UPI002ED9758F|nr:unnamed protein product [Priceomyces carsonii]
MIRSGLKGTEVRGDGNDVKELKQWLLKSNSLHNYSKFSENGITMDLIPELDTNSLKEIGINKVGDRIRLELAISDLKAERLSNKITVESLYTLLNLQLSNSNRNDNFKDLYTANDSSTLIALNGNTRGSSSKDSDKNITFILQDGSIKKVNVTGCFNAQSIKRKVLKRLGIKQQEATYDTYIHSIQNSEPGGINLLFDVELVTICYSPDRLEKHRIMLCPKDEKPSDAAIETSKKIINKFGKFLSGSQRSPPSNLSQYHIPDRHDSNMRNFFGQRPPSELISSNLAEYFPDTHQKELEATIRNSVRYSVRLSRQLYLPNSNTSLTSSSSLAVNQKSAPKPIYRSSSPNRASSITSGTSTGKKMQAARTIGEVMVNNVNALDEAVSLSDSQSLLYKSPSIYSGTGGQAGDVRSVLSGQSRQSGVHLKVSIATENGIKRHSRIELISVDSDSDDADDFISEYGTFTGGELGSNSGGTFDIASEDGPKYWLQGARIGSGSFGTVYLGMNPMTGELMAVKQVRFPDVSKSEHSKVAVFEALRREMFILKELNHENIVRYLGSSSDCDNQIFNIFIEYVPGGSVLSMLSSYGPFEEPLIRNFIRQVLIGLSYLHGEDIIHRDIKGANILIDIKGTVKISDFGISKKLNNDADNETRGRRASLQGSVYWMAPEVVKQTAYTKKADIWSVGCLVVEMFTGKHPFPDFSQMQAIFKIGTHIIPQIPEWCTLEAKDFLLKTFEIDYNLRPHAVDLLADSFLNTLIMSKTV